MLSCVSVLCVSRRSTGQRASAGTTSSTSTTQAASTWSARSPQRCSTYWTRSASESLTLIQLFIFLLVSTNMCVWHSNGWMVKGTVHPTFKTTCSLTVLLFYLFGLFWCELWRCLPSLQYNKTRRLEKLISNVSAGFMTQVTHDNPQTFLWAASCWSYFFFFSTELHLQTLSPQRRKPVSTHE